MHITSQGMPKVARALDSRMIKPHLYLDGFLFNTLLTLTTTSVPVANEQRRHETMVTWLRTNLLITIRAAVESRSYDPRALAICIALLIGWELVGASTHPSFALLLILRICGNRRSETRSRVAST